MSPFAPHVPPVWSRVSGRGTVWSFVVPHPPLLPWYAERAPYNVVLVALAEDPRVRLAAFLTEVPARGPRVGMRVAVAFEPPVDGIVLPVFRCLADAPPAS